MTFSAWEYVAERGTIECRMEMPFGELFKDWCGICLNTFDLMELSGNVGMS